MEIPQHELENPRGIVKVAGVDHGHSISPAKHTLSPPGLHLTVKWGAEQLPQSSVRSGIYIIWLAGDTDEI